MTKYIANCIMRYTMTKQIQALAVAYEAALAANTNAQAVLEQHELMTREHVATRYAPCGFLNEPVRRELAAKADEAQQDVFDALFSLVEAAPSAAVVLATTLVRARRDGEQLRRTGPSQVDEIWRAVGYVPAGVLAYLAVFLMSFQLAFAGLAAAASWRVFVAIWNHAVARFDKNTEHIPRLFQQLSALVSLPVELLSDEVLLVFSGRFHAEEAAFVAERQARAERIRQAGSEPHISLGFVPGAGYAAAAASSYSDDEYQPSFSHQPNCWEPSVNPANGFPMMAGGCIDVAGNAYGTDNF